MQEPLIIVAGHVVTLQDALVYGAVLALCCFSCWSG
jgi:hypothetical protein